MKKTGIIILAAGNSSRLGQPKQLLAYKKTTLLKNTIKEASLLSNTVVIVVTGSNQELIEKELQSDIKISHNPDWETGMSSSIVNGLQHLLHLYPDIEKCIFAVCDQPFVTASVFTNLIDEQQKTQKGIAASEYASTLGTPVLFDKKYFAELLELKGQEGAKKIINKYLNDTVAVAFEKGSIDIDTEDDYNKLMSEF